MAKERIDRRFRKTENSIYNAFIELVQTKRYNNITIQNILDKADIGRTTFYSHFQTKDDLFREMITNFMESFITGLTDEKIIIPVAQIYEHLQKNQYVIIGLFSSDNSNMITNRMMEYWSEKLTSRFTYEAEKRNIPVSLYINYIVSSFISMTRWWIDNNMRETPKQMEEYWVKLMIAYL
jgi:AcrR family transcriptional regulator